MSNLGFESAAPGGSARMSAQQVWQCVSEVTGQVAALSAKQTILHSTLHATLVSTVMGPAPSAAKLTQESQAKIENDDDIKALRGVFGRARK